MRKGVGLWRFGDIAGGKYLVERADGSVLHHPNIALGARDPCTPAALRAYAKRAEEIQFIGYQSATAAGRRPIIACYRITRRDGTRPDWSAAVMLAADPCAPAALRAYARACRELPAGGDAPMQGEYADDVERLAGEFELYRHRALDDGSAHGAPHRLDGTPQQRGAYAYEFFGDITLASETVVGGANLSRSAFVGGSFDSLAPVDGLPRWSVGRATWQITAANMRQAAMSALARDVRAMADEFEAYRAAHGAGDPAAPRHRTDDPATVERMKAGQSA